MEDDLAVRGVVTRVLSRMGHRVKAYACSQDIPDGFPFELALVDLNLGGTQGDGLRLIAELRARKPGAGYILTSGSRPVLDAPEQGGPHFLRKPFSREELASLISMFQDPD